MAKLTKTEAANLVTAATPETVGELLRACEALGEGVDEEQTIALSDPSTGLGGFLLKGYVAVSADAIERIGLRLNAIGEEVLALVDETEGSDLV